MKTTIHVPKSALADDQRRRKERIVQEETANKVDQDLFLFLMKKRGIIKNQKVEDLFRAVAPYLPCDEIIEVYTN